MFLRTETEDSTPLENERMEAPDTSCSKRDGVFALLNAGVKFEDVLQLYPQCEDIGREWVETGPPEASAGSQVLGVAAHLLEQSMSPLISESFRTNFLKALQNDPPEEFLCPIMHTLIKDPVVLSSDTWLIAQQRSTTREKCGFHNARLQENDWLTWYTQWSP